MRKLSMAVAVAAAALLAQGARADDAAKQRSEAVDATREQVKDQAQETKSDVKEGAHKTRDAAGAQMDKAENKAQETRSDMRSNDRSAQADRKHPLFEGKDNFEVDGKIQKVSKSSITLSREELPAATLRISKDTKVELDGQQVSAAQLKQGQDVKASFNLREDKPEAVEIKAEKMKDQK